MTHKEVKVPRLSSEDSDNCGTTGNLCPKRPRTQEDFYKFCTYILEYENYERLRQEEVSTKKSDSQCWSVVPVKVKVTQSNDFDQESRTAARTPPPLDSSGSSVNSESATSSGQEDKASDDESDVDTEDADNNEDSYDLVTCYCHKPFAGRPMIECSRCLTWVHLSCARIRRTHIPDVFYCALCKNQRHRSSRNSDLNPRPPKNPNSPPSSPQHKKMKRDSSL